MERVEGANSEVPGYTPERAVMEELLSVAYSGDWPAKVWGAVPGSSRVAVRYLSLPVLPPGHESFRIGFVSDIHVGPTTPDRVVNRAAALLNQGNPDVLLLGGDYVYLEATSSRLDRLGQFLESLDAPRKAAVIGNHDGWTHRSRIESALEDTGFSVLTNESLFFPDLGLDVTGLDDPWIGAPDMSGRVEEPDSTAHIVLCHSPEGLAYLEGTRPDLFLCGHTHGGMVSAPWGPVVLPKGDYCRKYPSGIGDFDGMPVITSNGIGGVSVAVRLFAPPDVWFVDVTAKGS